MSFVEREQCSERFHSNWSSRIFSTTHRGTTTTWSVIHTISVRPLHICGGGCMETISPPLGVCRRIPSGWVIPMQSLGKIALRSGSATRLLVPARMYTASIVADDTDLLRRNSSTWIWRSRHFGPHLYDCSPLTALEALNATLPLTLSPVRLKPQGLPISIAPPFLPSATGQHQLPHFHSGSHYTLERINKPHHHRDPCMQV
jgi:hypothetical protein